MADVVLDTKDSTVVKWFLEDLPKLRWGSPAGI